MRIGVLGPLSVDDGAVRLGFRDRVVLAALATRPGEVFSAEQLADVVWRDRQPASWHKNLQGCVVRLRKALGQDAIQTSPQGYRLAVPADTVDAQHFERLVERGRELLTVGGYERAMYTLGQALALWRGRPLVELEEWEPGAIEAGRLEELRLEAQDLRLEAALQAGHHREVLAEAKAMVDAAPLREQRWTMLALASTGRVIRATRCRPCKTLGGCWCKSWDSTLVRTSTPSSKPSFDKTPACSSKSLVRNEARRAPTVV